jgi:protein O-GlcNAc transferase
MTSHAINPVQQTSDLARRLYAEGVSLWDQGREAEAATRLDEALRQKPDFAEALNMGAYILDCRGAHEAALRFYQRALTLAPHLHSAWSNLGKLLFRFGRFTEALDAIEAALRIVPGDADAHNSRAGALRALGRIEACEAAAREALRLRPGFP